ncbi:hypothetical protein CERSUDRAFT_76772 [Gelatoporia subvermispora B]|uniref:Uncharacterized protein n=1 Tax=Ceriporiopsis subvermispora (strain B) TaxID=914234 RepID=M2PBT5_CERS8|nr:hypothetical protein CERSUDRAFT_76772 [Gelatoporia subvermispora B]
MPEPKTAIVKHIKEQDSLKLLSGNLDPEMLDRWETACHWHFLKISLTNELQVATVTSHLENPYLQIQCFLATHAGHLATLRLGVSLEGQDICSTPGEEVILGPGKRSTGQSKAGDENGRAIKALNEEHIENDKQVQAAIAKVIAKVKAPPNKTSNLFILHMAMISCMVNTPAGTKNKLPHLTETMCQLLCENDRCNQLTTSQSWSLATIRAAKNQKPMVAAIVEEKEEDKTNILAAVLPSRTMVYDSVSESELEYIELFTLPTLYWNGLLDGPLLSSPISVDALLDPGLHTVLVSSSPINQTGLCRYRLPNPKKIQQALEADNEIVFPQFPFSVHRPPSMYILCKTLNIILDPPFLKVNKINVDFHERTAIHKTSGYDVLNPMSMLDRAVSLPGMLLGERWSHVVAAMHSMIDQLCARLEQQQADIDRHMDAELKLQYANRFPTDIPHTNELPTNVYHAFHLEDFNKVIASRVYLCLRKPGGTSRSNI